MTNNNTHNLPEIPVIDVDENWVTSSLEQQTERAHRLLDAAAGRFPRFLLKIGDRRSRKWLTKNNSPYLQEIDQVASHMNRPGAHFLNISYEWGCTSKAAPCPENKNARLIRILDWPDQGLGEHVIALRIQNPLGEWTTLTWPGYVGVLQAVAKGRFAVGLNQGPMELTTGFYGLDWAINRIKIWPNIYMPPAHLLRYVFENARDYSEAKHLLKTTPIASPAIFIISGINKDESCVIERKLEEAYTIEGAASAANSWRVSGWKGCFRGEENDKRVEMMNQQQCCLNQDFNWLKPPVLNDRTRLAMIADANTGSVIAQGFEADGPATQLLRIES